MPRRFCRHALVGVLAGATALLSACEKVGTAGSSAPGKAGEQAGAFLLRYKPANLRQKSTLTTKFTGGGQYGELVAALEAAVKIQTEPSGKLRVAWKIDKVENVELKGAMAPKEGAPAPDPKKALLERGTGIYISDPRGETDEAATKGLAENKAKADEAEVRRKARADVESKAKAEGKTAPPPEDDGSGLIMALSSLFQLASLPEAGLEVGKPFKHEEEKEEIIQGSIKLPIEVATTYTLVKVDPSSGKRIAEIKQETEASGATEMGGGMLVVEQSITATLLFNVDDGIPVSLNYTSTQSFSFGDQGGENTSTLETMFSPG